jgi:hypothetical protein
MTTNAVYKRYVALKVSGHVSAGTGSFELRNFTQSTSGTAVTTTATTETAIAATTVSAQVTALADVITIRVKNSGAGGTVTIDAGGIMEADKILNVTATGDQYTTDTSGFGWFHAWKFYVLAGITTATYTAQPKYLLGDWLDGSQGNINFGSPISTLNAIQTITLPYKVYPTNAAKMIINFSAISGQVLLGQAWGFSADNI